MSKVLIFTTGGTIEKSYDEFEGSLSNRESLLRAKILRRLRLPHTEINIQEVCAMDSLHMRRSDRELIWKNVKEAIDANHHPVIILHGTDTMAETANVFYELCPHPPVPIVFTGAMKPMGFEDSDATQNFTEALMAAQICQPGIYIAFHSQLYKVPHVKKDREAGTFTSC